MPSMVRSGGSEVGLPAADGGHGHPFRDREIAMLLEAPGSPNIDPERVGSSPRTALSAPAAGPSGASGGANGGKSKGPTQEERIRALYPMVPERTPLPVTWSQKDKWMLIGLSQGDLRVHYKGNGKGHKDAASVRACHPIPAACGVYYFEVKVISKGRDGYIAIGLSAQGVDMNSQPGWNPKSYGFHADDGHSFSSSGTGQPYGPTFSTGDVIGCGVNLIENSCFFTKNGHNLGTAFTDLPRQLYPTVGLQTPGEVVEANFGQFPFVFDIQDLVQEVRHNVQFSVECFPVANDKGQWEAMQHRMVLTYLIHHGYIAAAEAFARITGQPFEEEVASIRHRQQIQKLVLNGMIAEAVELTESLYPTIFTRFPNLLFQLRIRQFIEMVAELRSSSAAGGGGGSGSGSSAPSCRPSAAFTPVIVKASSSSTVPPPAGGMGEGQASNGVTPMDVEEAAPSCSSVNGVSNGDAPPPPYPDSASSSSSSSASPSHDATMRMLAFGRELSELHRNMEPGAAEKNGRLLFDAFSILAYSAPGESPMAYLLDPAQRETVSAALNSAILETLGLPPKPPLEFALGHAFELIKAMSRLGYGACAFANVKDVLGITVTDKT